MFKGLRTVIYPVKDLQQGKAWYSKLLGQEPYFDSDGYVGYAVGGFELGLVPSDQDAPPSGGPPAYWGVDDIDSAFPRVLELGAKEQDPIQDVGGSIRLAVVTDPFGNAVGLIENPHFRVEDVH